MRTEVKSSLLKSIIYDPANQVLTVEFRGTEDRPGKVYEYSNVSQETYDKFVSAPSLGKHFLNEIKPAHPCKRVQEGNEDATSPKKGSKKKDTAPDGDPIPF